LTRKGAAVAKTAPSTRVDAQKTRDAPRRRNVAAAIEITPRRRNVAAAIEVRLAEWIWRRRGAADVVTMDGIMMRKKSIVQVAVVMPGVMSS
jgi:hypothetical protein